MELEIWSSNQGQCKKKNGGRGLDLRIGLGLGGSMGLGLGMRLDVWLGGSIGLEIAMGLDVGLGIGMGLGWWSVCYSFFFPKKSGKLPS